MPVEVALVEPLQRREEVVAKVVLELTRRPDDEPAREEAEQSADRGEPEQERRVEPDLLYRNRLVEIVDGVLQDPRSRQCERGGDDHA